MILKLNQDEQDEYFNCQEEFNTLTEEYSFTTSCKSKLWLLLLTIYTQQTVDQTRTISPTHIEIDFLIDPGATFNVLNMELGTTLKNHNILLKTSTFVLSAAMKTNLKSRGTVQLDFYPD